MIPIIENNKIKNYSIDDYYADINDEGEIDNTATKLLYYGDKIVPHTVNTDSWDYYDDDSFENRYSGSEKISVVYGKPFKEIPLDELKRIKKSILTDRDSFAEKYQMSDKDLIDLMNEINYQIDVKENHILTDDDFDDWCRENIWGKNKDEIPDETWEFYSDWHKEIYGVRPR